MNRQQGKDNPMNEERYTQAVCNLHGEKMTQHFSCHLCERERVAALAEMRRKAEAWDKLEKIVRNNPKVTLLCEEGVVGQKDLWSIYTRNPYFPKVERDDLLAAIESLPPKGQEETK
jgi:hypothetical protein